MSGIKWIILDMMGVIMETADDVSDLLVPYIQQHNGAITPEMVRKEYIETSLGRNSSYDFWKKFNMEKKYPAVEYDYLDIRPRIDFQATLFIKEAAKRYSLAILSNDIREWSSYLRKKHSLDETIGLSVISGDVGVRKPDPAIYRALLAGISGSNAAPSECLFVDDQLKNLKTAGELGILTMHFKRKGGEKDNCDYVPDGSAGSFRELEAWLHKTAHRKKV